ncbi:MAG: hypothetical protein JF614_08395 [Acidobacteria bacterium]|nr:hypothetical protein [Acidobacteriota bacterium]
MKTLRSNGLTRPTVVLAVLLLALAASSIVPAGVSACDFESEWYQTFYAEPEQVTVVGECYRPCYGWPSCTGTRTSYYSIVSWDCGGGACSP